MVSVGSNSSLNWCISFFGPLVDVRNVSLYDLWSFNQTKSEWTSWTSNLNYSPIQDQPPSYGPVGVFDNSTWPGSRSFSTCWKMRVRKSLSEGWDEPNLRDLFFLYGGVSFWNGGTTATGLLGANYSNPNKLCADICVF